MAAQRIREENEKRKLEGNSLGGDIKNGNVVCAQMDAKHIEDKPRDRSTNTREQRAKMSGVSSGTISRYDTVMKSDDEDSKLRALISNNFGRRKNDPSKDRKALETYVSLRGYKNGGDRQAQCQNGTLLSLDEIAKELNMSKR
ncbi:hypothetical protein [Anaerotignum sp.]